MRITALPCQLAPPAQHSPEAWTFRMVSDVIPSLPQAASTWLDTTSVYIVAGNGRAFANARRNALSHA